jgi:hypothetical protein
MLMITPLSNPMTTLNAISEMIEYSRSLTRRIYELTKENIRDAWDIEEALGDWIGGTGFADDEDAEDHVAFDIEFDDNDVNMGDVILGDERDVSTDNNNKWEDETSRKQSSIVNCQSLIVIHVFANPWEN